MEGDAAVYFLGKVAVGFIGVATVSVLARGLGVAGYGTYGIALASTVWIVQMSAGWVQQSVLRYRSRALRASPGSYRRLVGTATAASALIGGAVGTALLSRTVAPSVAIAASGAIALWIVYVVLAASAQSALRPGVVAVADVLRTGLPLAGYTTVWIARGSLSVEDVFASLALGYLVTDLVVAWRLGREREQPGPSAVAGQGSAPSRPDESADAGGSEADGGSPRSLLSSWLRYGLPYTAWFAVGGVQLLIGRYALLWFGTEVQLGIYSAWQDLASRGASLLFLPLTFALHARVMAAWNAGERDLAGRLLRRALLFVVAASLLAAAAGWLAVPLLERFLLGSDVAQPGYGWLLPALLAAEALSYLGLLVQKQLEARERTLRMALLMALATTTIGVLTLVLHPWLGVAGVVLALALGRLAYVAMTLGAGRDAGLIVRRIGDAPPAGPT
jgi:O-antigen/teichoic acid export membrane protein